MSQPKNITEVQFEQVDYDFRNKVNNQLSKLSSSHFELTLECYRVLYESKRHEYFNLSQDDYLKQLGVKVNITAVRNFKRLFTDSDFVEITELAKAGAIDYSVYIYDIANSYSKIDRSKMSLLVKIAKESRTRKDFLELLNTVLVTSADEPDFLDVIKRQGKSFSGILSKNLPELSSISDLKTVISIIDNMTAIVKNQITVLNRKAKETEEKQKAEIIADYEKTVKAPKKS